MRPSADAAERKRFHDRQRQGDPGGHLVLATAVVPLEAEAVVDAGVDAPQSGALGVGPPPSRGAVGRRREDARVHLPGRDAQRPSGALQAIGRRQAPVLQGVALRLQTSEGHRAHRPGLRASARHIALVGTELPAALRQQRLGLEQPPQVPRQHL